MSDARATPIVEPRLTTRRVRHRRTPRHVAVALPIALAGLISLLISGNTLRPFERIVTLDARMASKSDYFKDPEVQRLLLEHGIRVDIRRLGSRGIATQSLTGMDVVFPSGQPAAKLILDREDRTVISGLYACGTAAASAMGRCYAGGGISLGQSSVFGMLAAEDMCAGFAP